MMKKYMKKGGLTALGLAVMASQANAAIDVSGAVTEIQNGATALGTLGAAAIVFAGSAFAIFAVFRRVPRS